MTKSKLHLRMHILSFVLFNRTFVILLQFIDNSPCKFRKFEKLYCIMQDLKY
jgi:hypothetical protein